MDQTEIYKGYRIRTYQRVPGRWFADIQKQDGSEFLILAEPDGVPRRFIATTHSTATAEAAIELAKQAIDRGHDKVGGVVEMTELSNDEANNPLLADNRNFYTVEKWTKDGAKVERLLYAGNNLDEAREIFQRAIKHRPRIKLSIRQGTRVMEEWPP
jgi:hypothetical protein